MKNEILTTQLRNKTVVLAKVDQFGVNAVTYVNDKQANKKEMELKQQGIDCTVYIPYGSRIRFIQIK